jgi:hypothetical protein
MKTGIRSLIVIIAVSIAAFVLGHSWLFADQGNGGAAGQVAPDAPHSPAAIEAKRQYDLSVKLAKEEYRKALLSADQKYISDLEAAIKTAMNDGPSALEEAKRLDAARIAAINVMEEHKQEGSSRTVNLIPLIDVKRDAVSGTWTSDHGTIASDASGWALLRIPYEPPEEYDFRVEFVRISGGDDVSQIFRHSGHSCMWQMGAAGSSLCAFSTIDGAQAGETNNPTNFRKQGIIEDGRKYTALIQVRKGSVTASIDGKIISKCSLDASKFDILDAWSVGADGLGIGSWRSPTVFGVIEVTEISGPGRVLSHDR